MKRLITLAALLLAVVPCARGANYKMWQTAASGDWKDTLTWSVDSGDGVWRNAGAADGYPTAADSTVNIWNGYTVTVSPGDSVVVDQVFVMGQLVQAGGRISVNDGGGDDLQFFSTGQYTRYGGTIEGPGTTRFGYGTRYVHGMDGGDIPRAFWDNGSVLEFDSIGTARNCTATDQDFSNIYWNCYSQADTFTLAAQAGFHADDIFVQGTGTGVLQITSAACPRVTLDGSFEMAGGTVALLGGGDRTLSVQGNFTITTASDFYLCDAAHPGIDTLLLYGGYTHQATSIYGASGPDSSAIVFAGTGYHQYIASGGEMVYGYIDYVVMPGSTLDIGSGGLGRGSQGNFTLADGATLRSGNLYGLYGAGADTGAVLVAGTRTYSPRAHYDFYDAGMSTLIATGPGLPDTVTALTVENYYSVVLSKDLVVTDTLFLFTGSLILGPNRLELDGTTFSYDPTTGLAGTNASTLKIGGSGGIIYLPTVDLGSLIIDRPGGQVQFNGRMAKSSGAKGDMLERIADSTVMIAGRVTSNGAMFNYGPGAKLIYRGSAPQLTGTEVEYVPQLVIDNPTRVTMDQDVHVGDTLDLLQGVLYTANSTAYCSNGSETRRGTGWVAGNLAIEFTSPKEPKAMGSAWYYLGDTLDYTPAYLNFPLMSAGYFTIGVTNTVYPSANAPDSCLHRYWTYRTGGTTDTFDLRLSYSDRDFNLAFSDTGHEQSMIAARYTGAGLWQAATEVSRDTAANWVQITGNGGGKFTFAKNLSCLNNMSAISWQTMADGDWTDPNVWQFNDGTGWQPADSGLYPDDTGDSIIVWNSIAVTHDLTIDQLRVSGGLRHLAGTLTVHDGPGDDLVVDGGYFQRHGGGTLVQQGQLRFLPYAQYDHFIDGGDIPLAAWDSSSYITIDSVVAATQFASGISQSFGYLIWNDTSQTSNFTLASQAGFAARELDVYSTNTYGGGSLTLTSVAVPRLAIPGGFYALDSTCSVRIGQGGNRSLLIAGQFYNGGWFYANSPGFPGIDTLRLGGDFYDPTSRFVGLGQDSTFTIFSPGFHSYNGYGVELVSGHVNYQLDPGATVAVPQNDWLGRGSLGSFTMAPGATLQVADTAGIAATGIDSGAVRVQGARNYSPLASYVFDLSYQGPGRTGSGLPDSVRYLGTMGNAGDALLLSRDLTVTDTLAINYNTVNLDGHALAIEGPLSSTGGYLDGTPASQLVVRGGGAAFRLPTNLAGNVHLGVFTLDRPAGVSLTGNVYVHTQANLVNGALNTMGYTITAETTAVVIRTSGWVAGRLAKYVGTPFSAVTYEVGDSAHYSPADFNFGDVTSGDFLTVQADTGVAAHVDSTGRVLRRRWSFQTGDLGIDTCAITLHYLPGDFNPPRFTEAGDESTMIVGRFDDGAKRWDFPTVNLRNGGGISDGGSIGITGLHSYDLSGGTLTCGKNALAFSSGSSDTIWQTVNTGLALTWKNNVLWQYSADGGISWSPDTIPGWYPDYRYGSITVFYTDSAVVIDSSITLDQVQVYGQLRQTAGIITINDGPGDDLMVNGSFTRRGGSSAGTGAMRFGMMAHYVHEQNGGELASAMWDSQSVCQVTGITNARSFTGGMSQAFWNIEWNCPAQTDTFILANDPGFSAKYLGVNGSGSGILQLASAAKPRVTLRDGFSLFDGNVLLGSGGPRVLDVGGSFFVQHPGRLYLNNANAPAVDTLFLGGDYTHVMAGIHGGGPDSTAIVFNGVGRTQYYNASSESLFNFVDYALAPGAVLNIPMGRGIGQGSPGSFTLPDSATLIIENTDGIQQPGTPLGAVQVLGPRHYGKHATFKYNRFSSGPSVVTGPGLPDTVGTLEMNNSSQDMYGDLRLSRSVVIADSLMIYGHGFEMQPGCTLTINGKAVNVHDEPAPFIRTTSDNHLVFSGSGDTAHLYVESMDLASLTVNRTGTGVNLEMGGTMTVTQQLNLLNGPLTISGTGPFNLGNGSSIHRRAASSLSTAPVFGAKVNVFYGGGILTAGPELPKTPGTLRQLHVELVSDSVTVNGDLTINDTLGLGGGVLFVNGRTLGMRGPLDTMLLPGTIVTADSTTFGVHGRYCLPNIDGANLTLDSGAVQRGDIALRGQMTTAANDLVVGPHILAFSAQQAVSPNITTDQTSTLAYSGAANDSLPSSILQLGTLRLDLDSDTLSRTLRNGLTICKSLVRRNGRFNTGVVTLTYQPGSALVYQGGTKTMGQEAGPLTLPKVVININPTDSVRMDAVHTIGDTLRLDQGCLAIGPHALTVNKQITRLPAGALAGGPSSILILGGLNDTTHVPPVDLVQLSVNRPGGVLQPDSVITVHAMLNLTAGRLDNYDGLHTVALDSGALLSRVAGTISNNPVYHGPIDVFYLNPPVGTTVTGAEIPANPAILHNLAVQGTMQDTVQFSGNVTVNGHLDLSAMGCLKVANHTLTLRDSLIAPFSKGQARPGKSQSSIALDAARDGAKGPKRLLMDSTSSLVLNGTVPRLPGDIDTLGNLTLVYTPGTTIDTIRLYGQLTQLGGKLTAGTLRYAAGASLRYNGAAPQTTSDIEFPAANGPATLVVDNPTSVALHADRALSKLLQFNNGTLVTNANTITIDSGAAVSGAGASTFVQGKLARYIRSAASLDSFPVGGARGFAPVTLDFFGVTTPGFVTIASPDTFQPNVANPANCLNRYWQLNNGGIAFDSLRVSLAYLHGDFHGGISEPADENTMVAGQHGGPWTFPAVVSRDTAANTITLGAINGIADLALARTQGDIFIAPDTTRPYIASSLPADGAANVHGTDSVRITFSEPVRKSQVVYSFLPAPGTVDTAWSADSTTIVFNHGAFGSMQGYTVRVDSVRDNAGNPMAGRDSIVFTSADTSRPYVASTYPANGATGVNVNDSIVIAFNKRMDTTSVSVAAIPFVAFTGRQWDAPLQMLTLHHAPLVSDTIYSVFVQTAADSAGHQIAAEDTFSFRTPDTTAPAAPLLVSPANGAWQSASGVTFQWGSVTKKGAKSTPVQYVLQTDTSAAFASPALTTDTAGTTQLVKTLAEGRHYWRVRAYDLAGNQGPFSAYNMAGVDQSGPVASLLTSPANAARLNAGPVSFVWQPAADPLSGVSSYHLQCSPDSLFAAGVHDTVVTGVAATVALADTLYYWHVAATDNVGNSGPFSAANRFELDTQVPQVPAMVAPADSSWQAAAAVTFQWSAVGKKGAKATPVQYVLQTDTAASFTSPALTTDTVAATQLVKALAQGRHYWRVQAYDLAGNQSAFSPRRWAGIDQTAPGSVALLSPNNGGTTNTAAITFTWQPAADSLSGIGQYRLQCAFDSLFATGLRDTAVTGTTIALALPDSGYYWHVRAEDRVTNAGAYSAARRVVKDTRPPLVALTDPGNLATDVAVNKIIGITFSEPVQPAMVFITTSPVIAGLVRSWDSTGTRLALQHENLAAGIAYTVRIDSARDIAGNPLDTITLPARFAFTARAAALATTNWVGGEYRLVSVPVIPVDTTSLGNFGDDLGGYSDTTWMIYGYDPQGTFIAQPGIHNGQAYWLASAGNATLSVQGTANDQPTVLAVQPGWNLIGDPFAGMVTLSKVTVRSNGSSWAYNDTLNNYLLDSTVVRQRMWRYDDNSNNLANDGQWIAHTPFDTLNYRLQPWQGYALYAVRACTLAMQSDTGKAKRPAGNEAPQAVITWRLRVDAEAGGSADRDLEVGMSPQAREGYDRLDAEKPPLVSNAIEAEIPHPEWRQGPCSGYQYDYRPAAGYVEWPLRVRQPDGDRTGTLRLSASGQLGAGQRAYLVDRKLGTATEVTGGGAVSFTGSREFAVICTDKGLGELRLKPLAFGLDRLYPNPFAGRATISYQVPAAGKVSLKVYNITGQLVATLVEGEQAAGYYAARWDGRSAFGRGVASGVYLVRLGYGNQTRTEKLVKLQ